MVKVNFLLKLVMVLLEGFFFFIMEVLIMVLFVELSIVFFMVMFWVNIIIGISNSIENRRSLFFIFFNLFVNFIIKY